MASIGSLIGDRPVYAVQRDSSVLEAARCMAERNIGAIPVLEEKRLVGIVSERDVIRKVVAEKLDPGAVQVGEIMTRELVVADASENEESCLRKMKAAHCRHLPVVSGETLVGILSLRDLLQGELTEREEKLEFLTSYMFHLPPDSEKRPGA
ncbi:MAG TPA: CBS domain-containing protein [Bacteroidota bacterium]|jgi:CBS domain-containing protein